MTTKTIKTQRLNYVAIIPARGGSKGIKDKNLQMVGGVSLVARAIVEAQKVKQIQKIIVSTDSQKIADEAIKYGASVHFRSEKTASDTAKTIDVINEMLDFLPILESVCVLLQPTSPLRNACHIIASINAFEQNNAQGSVVTVTPSEHHPYKMMVLNEVGGFDPVRELADLQMPRQALPKAYRVNGAVYVKKIADLVSEQTFFGNPQAVIEMDTQSSIDIDTLADLQLANALIKNLDKEN
ncbi:acylneuraminate cytidylyltransferase [Moraxella macacae 0408225]|uniref:Acylneuraminate cytidylyltransferase n=1 Tax=Moraxella macacae 0408225 TaxID=1230338 RepID=L2F8Q8_9GAMM|nr:acylneuraminate cytidylyltransferase family protein [Moraxella macacae]ELA09290.1 acylneuraminate cytidylyltransferase [Moraxella macacae 0408225]